MFHCRKCGKCCTKFQFFPKGNKWRNELDSGDGTCRFLDRVSWLCTIYESRPLICNNVLYYDKYLRDSMTRDEFDVFLNEYCRKIRSDEV